MIGIYKITNNINGRIYIGQSVNISQRWKDHRTKINSSYEYNTPLKRAFRKYGINNFTFEIIETCSKDELDEKEQYYIEFYNSLTPNGYNIQKGGKNASVPQKLSYDDIQEIQNLLLNTRISQEEIAKQYDVSQVTISDINIGSTWVDEKLSYPLRNRARGRKIYTCIDCGKEIDHSSTRCFECSIKYRQGYTKISREELKNRIRTESFVSIGKDLGVSDNCIRKWCDKYNLPRKKSDIKSYSDEEWEKI